MDKEKCEIISVVAGMVRMQSPLYIAIFLLAFGCITVAALRSARGMKESTDFSLQFPFP